MALRNTEGNTDFSSGATWPGPGLGLFHPRKHKRLGSHKGKVRAFSNLLHFKGKSTEEKLFMFSLYVILNLNNEIPWQTALFPRD